MPNIIYKNAEMWVAVGEPYTGEGQSTIQHSFDQGHSWINSKSLCFGKNGIGQGVAYNPIDKMWVAVGHPSLDEPNVSTILYSKDGINWKNSQSECFGRGNTEGSGFGVAYNPIDESWVAVGQPGTNNGQSGTNTKYTILYSMDGMNWEGFQGSGGFGIGVDPDNDDDVPCGNGVAYNPIDRIWVAVGHPVGSGNSNIIYSTDGLNWKDSPSPCFGQGDSTVPTGPGTGNGVAYNPIDKMWVAVGKPTNSDSSTILHSKDGMIWTPSKTKGFGPWNDDPNVYNGGEGNGVAYSSHNRMWVAVGASYPYGIYATIQYSKDGITWTPANTPGFGTGDDSAGYGVVYGPHDKTWVAVGRPNGTGNVLQNILYSKDGVNWFCNTLGFFGTSEQASVFGISSEYMWWRRDNIYPS